MARCLTWCDLNAKLVDEVLELSGRPALEQFAARNLNLQNHTEDIKQGVLLDFYVETLKYAKTSEFTPDRFSAFFSIVKVNHFEAVGKRLTMECSFKYFKDLLLRHSVQRPPYSVGLFSFQEIKAITDYMINTYYRHYKLYQYVYTKCYTLDFSESAPLVETIPELVPLAAALSARRWQEYQDELARQAAEVKAAREKAIAEGLAVEEESEKQEEYMTAVPDEIFEQVQRVFDEKMVFVREEMENQFKTQEEHLLEKIVALEEAAAASGGLTSKPNTAGSGKGKKK